MKNFWVRTASAVVYVVLFIGCIYSGALLHNALLGGLILTAFLLFVAVGCTFEFFRIVGKQGATPCRPLGYVYTVGALLMISLVPVLSAGYGFTLTWLAYTLFPVLFAFAAIAQLWNHSEQPFREAAYTMVPMLYAAIPLGLMPWLHVNYNALVMVLIMVWMNDNGAYMGGSLYGKHKMWPRHSPGKTWEGFLGSCAITVLLAWVLSLIPYFQATGFTLWQWIVLALLTEIFGLVGDLIESLFKRKAGVKDSGNLIPGHGGVLDRLDSILFATLPVYAFCLAIGF